MTGILWVEAKDPVKQHTMHRKAPTAKNSHGPNANGDQVGRPCYRDLPKNKADHNYLLKSSVLATE